MTLALPDGLVHTYALKGKADPPLPDAKIQLEIPCKSPHTENFTITNWLHTSQQFQVATTLVGPSSSKNLYSISGNQLIDVPPDGYRDYKWTINPISEGSYNLKVPNTKKLIVFYIKRTLGRIHQ